MNSIQPAVRELERIYDKACSLFKNLEKDHDFTLAETRPVILVQTKGRKSALGWFWAQRWENGDGELHELTITAEYLKRPVHEIAETMVHEMVHHFNFLRGVKDCNASQYHNRKFAEICEAVGLLVEKGKRGFAYTDLSEPLRAKVDSWKLNADAFALARTVPLTVKAPTKLKKWTCGCGINIRVARSDFSATCNFCDTAFEEQ